MARSDRKPVLSEAEGSQIANREPGRGVVIVAHPEFPPDPRSVQVLERLSYSGLLALPPVALPDLHLKPALETPSSTATATRDTLVLGLTSPSPNCGMALAATSLGEDDLEDERLDELFGRLAVALDPGGRPPVIDDATLDDILIHGADAVTHRASSITDIAIEGVGRAFSPNEATADRAAILASVPAGFRPLARREFGLIGRGNHFLEVQVADEVLDESIAAAWGLSRGQVMVMYHADSGHLGAITGRLFAHRRKNSLRGRLVEWQVKLPYHLRDDASLGARWGRLRYFLPHRWLPIQADSDEGQRCRWALGAAANYAFAGRMAVLETLGQTLKQVWGLTADRPRLLYDAPHNGIWQEQVGERTLWVHRHNAVRVTPPSCFPADSTYRGTGHPILLPGTERTSSYLCASSEGSAGFLFSAGHGAGHTVKALEHVLDRPARVTRVYRYGGPPVELRPHLSDDGVDAVLQALSIHDIARPVVRVRPVAVLKG
jgi:tRNA-splicing ligase RtcB